MNEAAIFDLAVEVAKADYNAAIAREKIAAGFWKLAQDRVVAAGKKLEEARYEAAQAKKRE